MNLRKRRRLRLTAIILAALLLGTALLVCFRYEPLLSELAVTQVQNVTANLLNAAVEKELAQGEISYSSLVHMETGPDGRITALTSDMHEINRLKAEILTLLSEEFSEISEEEFGIPLGSVVLPLFCSGRGPKIPVRYCAIRSSDARFENEFSQAGINQTLHQIVLYADISVTVLLPTGKKDITVSTDLVVAQTVIVGEVPQTVVTMTGENNGNQR